MKYWLIEIIHNMNIICNGIFWFVPLITLRDLGITISPELSKIWFGSCLGVLFIPSRETLIQLLT